MCAVSGRFFKVCSNLKFHSKPTSSRQLHCPQIASDIKYCQSQGKIILLSLGGWTSTTDAPDATTFADQLWDLFGEGSSQHKPFDDALIDGFDWDIEHEPGVDIVAVANALHKHYKSGSKKYYMSAAPFCSGLSTQPYNQKFLESVYLDFIWPQFYNDWCSNAYYGSTPSAGQFYMNFIDWNKWATGGGNPNPNVKLYVGAIAGDHAGNPNDFVGTQKTTEELSGLQKQFPGSFGGAMYWDASYAYDESPNYAALAKSAMAGGASCKSSGRPPKITTTTTDFQTTTTTTKGHKTKTTDVVTTTTEIGTTSTPPTTTTSSVSGGPTPSVGQCSDSNNGQAVCSSPGTAASYQQCVNGNWLARQCGPGTVCVQNGSSSISCGFVSGKNVKGNNVIVKENVTKKKGKSKHNQYYSPLEKLPQFPPNQKYRPM